ncbi:response regulator receiver protein [Fibrella aestuarina BUZ 2]|uniref:Response regulator receiver protein n=1 Tax=Fibrella aestuarina BUZ 2 TaxID=1166018 RepID=I0K9W8_9BACT|nr:response regulator [Fibrella aestuarina]CCH00921.1 response regulator receiver protein [Fibrella aestuarina BUZ 2]
MTPSLNNPGFHPKPDVRQTQVMLIDDNIDQLALLHQAIRRGLPNLKVIPAATGVEALVYLESHAHQPWAMPKLILLDLYLPRREDGWHTLLGIQQLPPPFNRIPVIILSASNDQDDIRAAYRRGCLTYLIKPTTTVGWQAYCNTLTSLW